jgi:Ca2+-binding RTX toxin-like protein
MFGDEGDDELYGGPGDDAMEGEEGTDEHFGGQDNDYIDAADQDVGDASDLVDCGGGNDTAEVLPNDIVRGNCEEVIEVVAITTGTDSGTTDDEEQQQQSEAFRQQRGG